MSISESNSEKNNEASLLYFVTCFLDESSGNRDSDYGKLEKIFKSKSIDEMFKSVQNLGETFKQPYGKGILVERKINGFAIDKYCWFVKFEGEVNHLRAFIEKEGVAIKPNDKLIIMEIKLQNIAMQHPYEHEFYQWNC